MNKIILRIYIYKPSQYVTS